MSDRTGSGPGSGSGTSAAGRRPPTPARQPAPPVEQPGALPDYAPMGSAVRSDAERWPTLTPGGQERLNRWRADPAAPVWVHECGDLLTVDDHRALDAWREGLTDNGGLWAGSRPLSPVPGDRPGAHIGEHPQWVDELVDRCRRHTGFYRRLGATSFGDLPTIVRADLVRDVSDFMPMDIPLDRVVQGTSSGSSGAALVIPVHPLEISRDVVLIEHLLGSLGLTWAPEPGRFALLSVVDQRQAFTYASVMTHRAEQMMARVNLDDSGWRRPGDRERFIEATRPQVVTGSALSLLRFAELALDVQPMALVSGAVELTPAARSRLEGRFGVPVLDLYGLRETGPVAASHGGAHVIVPRRVHVEAVDERGAGVPDGTRGELTVTVDENPYLPLLRYRTGDTGVLGWEGSRRVIRDLDGRAPVVFRGAHGRAVPSVDLTQQLQHLGALAWSVSQDSTGAVEARVLGGQADLVATALRGALGDVVAVEQVTTAADLGPGKPRRFSSELTDFGR